MKTQSIKFFLLILSFFLFSLASGTLSESGAAIYKYVDKQGGVHFTDSLESIPREYRNQIQTLPEEKTPQSAEKPAAEPEKKEEGKGQPGMTEAAQRQAREQALQEKQAEERKQKAFDEKVKRIEDLRKEIEARQKELQGLRTTWMVYDRNTVLRLNQEIADLRKEIEKIQSELAEEK
jgi:hypothetical protein